MQNLSSTYESGVTASSKKLKCAITVPDTPYNGMGGPLWPWPAP